MSHSNPAPEFVELDEVSASFCISNDLTQEDVPPAIVKDAAFAGDEVNATIDFRTNVTLIVAAGRMLGPDPRGRHYFDRDGVQALEVQGESGSSKPVKIPLEVNDGDWGIGLFRSREEIPSAEESEVQAVDSLRMTWPEFLAQYGLTPPVLATESNQIKNFTMLTDSCVRAPTSKSPAPKSLPVVLEGKFQLTPKETLVAGPYVGSAGLVATMKWPSLKSSARRQACEAKSGIILQEATSRRTWQ